MGIVVAQCRLWHGQRWLPTEGRRPPRLRHRDRRYGRFL